MENKNQLLAFLETNGPATRTAITEATDIKGLQLFNVLRTLVADGLIKEEGQDDDKTYCCVPSTGLTTDSVPQTEAIVKSPVGRDNSKLTFNGQQYGKGPLVRAVVAKYAEDHPEVTFNALKEIFPDSLLKRFGIFQNQETAKTIANKGNRYFTKPEQIILLADASVVVCNQFTTDNLKPFLKAARSLGYQIS